MGSTDRSDAGENALCRHVFAALEQLKACDIQILDIRHLTPLTDTLIIASGRSDRQVRAMTDRVIRAAGELGVRPLGVEGKHEANWVLVDLGELIAHLMSPTTREYYQLDRLWGGISPGTTGTGLTEAIAVSADSADTGSEPRPR